MADRADVLKYIRDRAFEQASGSFKPFDLYKEPSISYITLFLTEHPDFCESLEAKRDHALDDLFSAVERWVSSSRRQITDVPDYVKDICTVGLEASKRFECYVNLQFHHGCETHGDENGFVTGHITPADGFIWLIEEAAFRHPIAVPAFSYPERPIFVRKNSFFYDSAIKNDALKRPKIYGLPEFANKELLLIDIHHNYHLRALLLHEQAEQKKKEIMQELGGNGNKDWIVKELICDHYALLKSPELQRVMLLDCLVRSPESLPSLFLAYLIQHKPEQQYKLIQNLARRKQTIESITEDANKAWKNLYTNPEIFLQHG